MSNVSCRQKPISELLSPKDTHHDQVKLIKLVLLWGLSFCIREVDVKEYLHSDITSLYLSFFNVSFVTGLQNISAQVNWCSYLFCGR